MIDNCKVNIMTAFPDFARPGFDIQRYNQRFKDSNMMIHARSKDVAYPEHWGSLSVKCAFNGNEYYQSGSCHYTVNDTNYLIFNDGRTYSSHIYSDKEVESFTVNFSPAFERKVVVGFLLTDQTNLDDPDFTKPDRHEFVEKLYPHDQFVSPVLKQLKNLAENFENNRERIEELYHELLINMLREQQGVWNEIRKINAIKLSTKAELYRRLHQAKDYMDSCYAESINLEKLGLITCLNTAYFLRQFKSFFGITPRQYLIKKRMEAALLMLQGFDRSITEICYETGYSELSSFGKLFKQFYGISPEQYQQNSMKKSIPA